MWDEPFDTRHIPWASRGKKGQTRKPPTIFRHDVLRSLSTVLLLSGWSFHFRHSDKRDWYLVAQPHRHHVISALGLSPQLSPPDKHLTYLMLLSLEVPDDMRER